MKRQVFILIVSLLMVAGKVAAEDCTVSGPTASTSVCVGGSVTLTVTPGGGTPPYSFQWYSNTVDDNTSGTIITGETSASYNPPTSSAGTIYYYCTVSSSTCTAKASATGEVIVNPLPVMTTSDTKTI
ncbi:MAG TPA: hypothetical protein DD745_01350, partial [Bacteroidales bacterium]|nr:hypothetical protein [Bacteroidales bacterium]